MPWLPSQPLDILLIEDNPGDVRLVREAFAGAPYASRVVSVGDGEMALERLRRPPTEGPAPDLIFLDLNLPGMDGRHLLGEIKGDAGLRRIPVVVLTSSEAPDDVHRAYDLQANCYVIKPAELDRFFEVLQFLGRFWLNTATLPG